MNGCIEDGSPALAEERRQRIADAVTSRGRVVLGELVREMGVTAPTIRRDLDELQHRRLLRRTHGGAIANEAGPEERHEGPRELRPEAAERIAAAVLAHLRPGTTVFLEGGGILELVAERIRVRDLSILTNSFEVARLVADRPGIRHTLTGGELRRACGTLVGPLALETLGRFAFDLAILGAGGLTEGVVSVPDLGEAQIKQAALSRARRAILAIDSSRFGRSDFVEVGRLDRFDLVITNRAMPGARGWCEDHGAALEVAELPPGQLRRPTGPSPRPGRPALQEPDTIP